uniref:Transporter n=1 Tax=Parastrongyloides trichosuri TaxID=131310 RepID=A0A0N4Z6Q9_PARTI
MNKELVMTTQNERVPLICSKSNDSIFNCSVKNEKEDIKIGKNKSDRSIDFEKLIRSKHSVEFVTSQKSREDGLETFLNSRMDITQHTKSLEILDDNISVDVNVTPPPNINNVNKEERGQWNNKWQFILTCIGFAVGIGNIWRFPAVAYENGGSAFLIPYLICSILIGIPVLLLEMSLGQYSGAGASVTYGRITPLLNSLGWGMICVCGFIGTFYIIVFTWIFYYIIEIITGNIETISTCGHKWNTEYCISNFADYGCSLKSGNLINSSYIFFNDTCNLVPTGIEASQYRIELFNNNSIDYSKIINAGEEFFFRNMLQFNSNFSEGIFQVNWYLLFLFTLLWGLVILIIFKGVAIIGKISLVASTAPYIIIMGFFAFGLTLDGSYTGIEYYLFKPEWGKIFELSTWKAAANQICFSLSAGIGGLLSLTSYNRRDHYIYKDVIIIIVADAFMSIFGGVAVFSILGFMAKKIGKEVSDVVQSGTTLAFIVYPEAALYSPIPTIFSLLFFIMLFLLALTTQICYVDNLTVGVYDNFPKLRKYKIIVCILPIFLLYILGTPMVTKSGFYIFNVFNEFTCSFNVLIMIAIECAMVAWIYDFKNYQRDLQEMMGIPTKCFSKFFGSSGYFIYYCWAYITPIITILLSIKVFFELLTAKLVFGEGDYKVVVSGGLKGLAWFIVMLPLIIVFGGIIRHIINIFKKKNTLIKLLKPTSEWPSEDLYQESNLCNFLRKKGFKEVNCNNN